MKLSRWYFPVLSVWLAGMLPAAAQSVVSTHAGVVHYFEGAVTIGGAPLQPQFGRFPELPDGSELRTAQGRAELLLGPGVILRMAEDTGVKMISSSLADTRLELLSGSAILEAKAARAGNSLTVQYKDWRIRVPKQGVYRIDTEPGQIRVYNGDVEVRSLQDAAVTVSAGQTLPLASVLVADETVGPPGDEFNSWAFDRSEAIAADDATAAQIVDDPALYPDLSAASGLSLAGYTYFPAAIGYASPAYGAYGAITPYLGSYAGYSYGVRVGSPLRPIYPSLPGRVTMPPVRIQIPNTGGYHPIGSPAPRPRIPTIPHTLPTTVRGVHR